MLHRYNLYLDVLLGVLLAAGLVWPRLGSQVFRIIERWCSSWATHRAACVAGVAVLLVGLRLASWPSDGIPIPYIHDEFSYLLAADTFAHGRLANPPHSLWVFFETFHVNMLPAYISKYPPAQGAVLALGQLLGHPWFGVLLSMAGMCAAVTWMMQGWMPARWALLGGIVTVARFYAYNDWMDSYWGGAAAAMGGALALGALPRLLQKRNWRDGVLLGLGIAILANSRPYEGIFFCLPVIGMLGWWILRGTPGAPPAGRVRALVPIAGVLIVCAAFMAYYNWRGTGNALLFPYVVNDRTYLSTPHFSWQELQAPRHYGNPQFDDFYNGWAREIWRKGRLTPTLGGLAAAAGKRLEMLQEFYLPIGFLLPLVAALPWLLRNRKARFLLLVCASMVAGLLPVVWFQPHYAAPMTAAAMAASVFGLRYVRTLRWRGRPLGLGLSRALVICYLLPVYLGLAGIGVEYRVPHPVPGWARARQGIEARLEAEPGQHLVLVRYGAKHDPAQEWVYNRAEIDSAKVVWAREIPGADLRPLLDYFHGRQVWQIGADASGFPLERYAPGQKP